MMNYKNNNISQPPMRVVPKNFPLTTEICGVLSIMLDQLSRYDASGTNQGKIE